jgi:hypothetical protein
MSRFYHQASGVRLQIVRSCPSSRSPKFKT